MAKRRLSKLIRAKASLSLWLLASGLSACAALPADTDRSSVERLLSDRGVMASPASTSDAESLKAWMAQPMTAEAAERVAMVKSPRLGVIYGQLGLAHAEVMEAVQVSNPRLGLSSLSVDGGHGSLQTQGIALPLADLILLPSRVKLAGREQQRVRYQMAAAILDVRLDVEAAWYQAVGAQQVAQMRMAVAQALKASADLAERHFDAGNISELDLSREQAAASEAMITAQRAAITARATRASLDSLIGLGPDDGAWPLGAALPLPVEQEDKAEDLLPLAMTSNLDLMAADQASRVQDSLAGTTLNTRWLGDTTAGLERERDKDGIRASGPALALELPLFNQGQAKVARTAAKRDLAKAQKAQLTLHLQNQIAALTEEVRRRRDILDLHSASLIPQRQSVAVRSQEHQAYMLLGIFAVIEAKTREYDAYQGYFEALRDYWLARTELTRLVGARLPSGIAPLRMAPGASDFLAPPPPMDPNMPGMDHSPDHELDPEKGGRP